jgi:3-hydroxyisobutyrate dehydrogenase
MGLGDTIGFIGLGRMGLPMSSLLAGAGYRVRGFDVLAEARETAAAGGVQAVGSPAEAASGAGTVILMLPSSDIVGGVVADGLLDAMTPGSLLVDMSSSDATRTMELAEDVRGRGVRFVDAPVSGGVAGARAGTLTIMAGGEAADVEDCRQMLETLGREVRHVGAAGAGHALKALNNLLSATSLLASCEALVAAQRFGLDPELVLEVVNQSSGRSWSTQHKLPAFVLPETFDSGFALALMVKDMQIAAGVARSVGAPAALGEAAIALWLQAAEALPPDADHTEIARWVIDRALSARDEDA